MLLKQSIACVIVLSCLACAQRSSVKTEKADEAGVTGGYTLILFGGTYSGDLRAVALLDRDNDGVELRPFAPEFDYRVIGGLTADQALRKAEDFLRSNPEVMNVLLHKISDGEAMIGYEIRARYLPYAVGVDDPLDIHYRRHDEVVDVYISLKPDVERGLVRPDHPEMQ